jgi:hypothetical protein
MKREYNDDDDDQEIDYGDILSGGTSSSFPETTPLVSMGLPDGVDLNLTRGDFHNDEIFYAYKRAMSFLAIALHVEHHEPLQKGDFCFGQEIAEDQRQEEVFFPPASDKPPKLHL